MRLTRTAQMTAGRAQYEADQDCADDRGQGTVTHVTEPDLAVPTL